MRQEREIEREREKERAREESIPTSRRPGQQSRVAAHRVVLFAFQIGGWKRARLFFINFFLPAVVDTTWVKGTRKQRERAREREPDNQYAQNAQNHTLKNYFDKGFGQRVEFIDEGFGFQVFILPIPKQHTHMKNTSISNKGREASQSKERTHKSTDKMQD
jgi:hypothetical protein